MPNTPAAAFTLDQLDQLLRWGDQRPCGLRVSVTSDRTELDEVVELFQRDRRCPVYSLTRKASGMVEVATMHGPFALVADLPTALALVEALGLVLEDGLDAAFARHRALGRACRAGIKAIGLELYSPDDDSAAGQRPVVDSHHHGIGDGIRLLVLHLGFVRLTAHTWLP